MSNIWVQIQCRTTLSSLGNGHAMEESSVILMQVFSVGVVNLCDFLDLIGFFKVAHYARFIEALAYVNIENNAKGVINAIQLV